MIFLDLDAGTKVLRKLGAVFCDVIYTLISKIYELFITVARLNILSSDQIAPIYQRVTMILTIVMTFYITLEFVKYTINPDEFSDKEKGAGNILKRVIIVIGLIAFTPTIFSTAYKLQNRIIETNLIPKMILGTTNTDYTSYGNDFSANMLNMFYYYDEEVCGDSGGLNSECDEAKTVVEENLQRIRDTGDADITNGINLSSAKITFKEKYPAIRFNAILAIVVGGFILYILTLYSIDVGVRYAQMIFLQIMAPVAIIGYIVPKKDGIFQKWGKQCITTYLDLFIRMVIINFVLLLIKVLGDAFSSGDIFAGIGEVSDSLKVFTYIVLVMGLLLFAQRAPKLLNDLLPGTGGGIGMGLSGKERFEGMKKSLGGLWGGAKAPVVAGGKVVGAGRRVVGRVGGAVGGAWKNRGNGAGAMLKGAQAGGKAGGSKDMKGLVGGSVWQRMRSASNAAEGVYQSIEDFQNNAGTGANPNQAIFNSEYWKNKIREYERRKANMDAYSKVLSNADSAVKDMKFMKQLEGAKQIAQADNNGEAAQLIENQISVIKKYARQYSVTKSSADLGLLQAELDKITDAFARHGRTDVKFDTEKDEIAKWGNIKISVEQAAKIASAVAAEKMDDGRAIHENSKGTITEDGNGNYEVTAANMGKFAYNMGPIDDAIKNATNEMLSSDDYKNAQAYAKGINTGGNQ